MTQYSELDTLLAGLLTELESDPNLREALRRHILTQEVMKVPDTMAALVEKVDTMAQAMVQMQTDVASVRAETGDLHRAQNIQEGVLSEAAGAAYEHTAIRLAPRLFRRILGLTDTTLFSHQPTEQHGKLRAMAETPQQVGAVSSEEVEDLLETDMVFKAKGPAGEVFIVVEASLTVQANDVVRASRRAGTLNWIVAAAGLAPTVVAVVMGKAISEDAQALLAGQAGETGKVTFLAANADAPDTWGR